MTLGLALRHRASPGRGNQRRPSCTWALTAHGGVLLGPAQGGVLHSLRGM